MQAPINEARGMFMHNMPSPRCLVVVDKVVADVQAVVSRFDTGGWAVTWIDFDGLLDPNILGMLSAIIETVDLVYIVITTDYVSMVDMGYAFGMAKASNRPVFIDYRIGSGMTDLPATFKLADGIGFGVDDLSLFVDTYEAHRELSDPMLRARSVANKIKRIRML